MQSKNIFNQSAGTTLCGSCNLTCAGKNIRFTGKLKYDGAHSFRFTIICLKNLLKITLF